MSAAGGNGPRTRAFTLAGAGAGIAATLAAVLVLAPNLSAGFGPVDDGESLAWLKPDGTLGVGDYLGTLGKTELGDLGQSSGRFRPFYYLLRVGQAVAFGDHAAGWYVGVIATYLLAGALWGWVFGLWSAAGTSTLSLRPSWRAALPTAVAAVGALCVLSLPFWTGVATRLGPQEGLGLAVAGVVALGATGMVMRPSAWWWVPLGLGTAAATTTKESLLVLAVVPIVIAAYVSRERPLRAISWTVAILSVLPAVFTAWVLASFGSRQGSYYGGGTFSERVIGGVTSLLTVYRWYWVPAAALCLAALALLTVALRGRGMREVVVLSVFGGTLVAWLFFDSAVYGGIYSVPRYAAALEFMRLPLTFGALALGAATVGICVTEVRGRPLTVGAVALTVLSVVLVGASLVRVPAGLSAVHEAAAVNAERTRNWQADLDALAQAVDALNPNQVAAVVVSDTALVEAAHNAVRETTRRADGGGSVVMVPGTEGDPALSSLIDTFDGPGAQPPGLDSVALCALVGRNDVLPAFCDGIPTLTLRGWSM